MARAPHPTRVLLIFYADNHTIRVSCQIPYNMKQVHCSAPGPRKGSPRTFLPRITSCRTTEHGCGGVAATSWHTPGVTWGWRHLCDRYELFWEESLPVGQGRRMTTHCRRCCVARAPLFRSVQFLQEHRLYWRVGHANSEPGERLGGASLAGLVPQRTHVADGGSSVVSPSAEQA